MKYNIAIVPSKRIEELSIAISKRLYNRSGEFYLGSTMNFPHITIAHFKCGGMDALQDVINGCEVHIGTMAPFDLIQNQYRAQNGWIDMSFEISGQLLNMYNVALQILLDNKCEKTSDDWSDNAPHITLSRFKDNIDIDLRMLPQSDFSFTVKKIGIFEIGEHGTNTKMTKQFILN